MKKMKMFEADLDPEMGWPRVRFNFSNGWSALIVLRTGRDGMDAMMASVAACPTGHWGEGRTNIGATEASPDEAIAWLNDVSVRAPAS